MNSELLSTEGHFFSPFIKLEVFENNISIDIDINVAYSSDIVNKNNILYLKNDMPVT